MKIEFREIKVNRYLLIASIIFLVLAGFFANFLILRSKNQNEQNQAKDMPQLPQVQDAQITQENQIAQSQPANTENNTSKGGIQTPVDSNTQSSRNKTAIIQPIQYQPLDYSYSFSQSQSQSIKVSVPSDNISVNVSQHQSQSN